jgi:hypothetical protein
MHNLISPHRNKEAFELLDFPSLIMAIVGDVSLSLTLNPTLKKTFLLLTLII